MAVSSGSARCWTKKSVASEMRSVGASVGIQMVDINTRRAGPQNKPAWSFRKYEKFQRKKKEIRYQNKTASKNVILDLIHSLRLNLAILNVTRFLHTFIVAFWDLLKKDIARSLEYKGDKRSEYSVFWWGYTEEGGGWSTPRPGCFTPDKETRYPLYIKPLGPQGRSGWVRKISPPTGVRTPGHLASSGSLSRLRYSGRLLKRINYSLNKGWRSLLCPDVPYAIL